MTRLPEGVADRIAALVKEIVGEQNLGLVEVREALLKDGIKVSMPTIGKEAYRLGLKPPVGRRKGTKLSPEAKRGTGRPRGPGKKFSLHRKRALELRTYHNLNNQEIADILTQESAESSEPRTFTREGVRQLLLTDEK